MGDLKTLAMALCLAVPGLPSGAAPSDVQREFAACTGRLSAQLEHQWLMMDPASGRTESTRNDLADVLEALTTAETRREILSIRIAAKHAHSELLHRSIFNPDAGDAAWAQRRADREVAVCAAHVRVRGDAEERS